MRTLLTGPASQAPSRHRRTCLRLAASAAVKEGVPIGDAALAGGSRLPPVVRLILDHYLAKKDGKIVSFTIDLAERLYAIARVYVKAPETQLRRAGAILHQAAQAPSVRPDGEEHGGDPAIQGSEEPRAAQGPAGTTLRRSLGGA